ncbi:hypothetical protein NDU88_004294 [Pleurodeles waltl]|uniref:Uncharacterized protein n=1 Tax=Pleurodeles waltl TaxID=8319 RepID=A0AAV7RFC9_PLEWA|nr:hypothetical protein NDU88_004294 [Pleurodeles waltl]
MTTEYPRGTRRSLLPPDTPVWDNVRPMNDCQRDLNTEVQRGGKREAEPAMEDAEKEFGEYTQLKLDMLKEQTRGGATEKTTDPDY